MPTITRVTAGSQASTDDLNQLIDLLEGTSGYELAFLLRCITSSDFKIRLADASGTREFIIQDSAGVSVATIDSDGNMTLNGSFAPTTLLVPSTTTPSQTTEAEMKWDSDDDLPTFGTGAATKYIGLSRGAGSDASATRELMYDTTNAQMKVWDGSVSRIVTPVVKYKTSAQQFSTNTTFADITASSGNFSFEVAANGVYTARYILPLSFGGTGGAKVQLTGPASPTRVSYTTQYETVQHVARDAGAGFNQGISLPNITASSGTSFGSLFAVDSNGSANNASSANVTEGLQTSTTLVIDLLVVNGSTAGTVTLQGAQNSSNSTTDFGAGCWMEAQMVG